MSDAVTDALEQEVEGAPTERAYRYTIRVLYAVGLLANLYWLWTMVKDEPETQIMVARMRQRVDKLRNCEGCRRRKEALHRALWAMNQEAERIVNEAADG